jgi:phage protein D
MHDELVFSIVRPGRLTVATPYVSGLPIRATWGQQPYRGTFLGYVDKVLTPSSMVGNEVHQRVMDVTCVGATFWMKDASRHVYAGHTADEVAKDVANRFGLACVADKHDFVWETLPVAGSSWWKFLVDLAKKIGYTLFVIDTTLYFIDRRKTSGHVRAPQRYRLTRRPTEYRDVLLFRPRVSAGGGVNAQPGDHVVRGLDAMTGDPITVRSGTVARFGTTQVYTPQFERSVDSSAASLAEAKMHASAAESAGLFTTIADMSVRGNPQLRAGGVIDLVVDEASTIYRGTWYILDAWHNVLSTQYTTNLVIGTDSSGTAPSIPTRSRFNDRFPKNLPPSVFRANRWGAQWSTK